VVGGLWGWGTQRSAPTWVSVPSFYTLNWERGREWEGNLDTICASLIILNISYYSGKCAIYMFNWEGWGEVWCGGDSFPQTLSANLRLYVGCGEGGSMQLVPIYFIGSVRLAPILANCALCTYFSWGFVLPYSCILFTSTFIWCRNNKLVLKGIEWLGKKLSCQLLWKSLKCSTWISFWTVNIKWGYCPLSLNYMKENLFFLSKMKCSNKQLFYVLYNLYNELLSEYILNIICQIRQTTIILWHGTHRYG